MEITQYYNFHYAGSTVSTEVVLTVAINSGDRINDQGDESQLITDLADLLMPLAEAALVQRYGSGQTPTLNTIIRNFTDSVVIEPPE
ncbi:MAG: hypothetical protein ABWY81_11075 [Jiangellaceae bacterium]